MTPPLSPDLVQIAKLLDRSRPQVVVVVGTGVAINATGQPHASWLGLLKHGIRHLVATDCFTKNHGEKLESSLNAAFSPFQLQAALQHAETVEQVLNTPNEKAFAQWLESGFATFKSRNEEKAKAPLDALRDLHEAGALLLTTNYDSLLSDITGAPPVTWEEHADFHRVMTRQKAGILHIHGHWQRPSSIVLGRSSYDRVVADVSLQQLFRTLWLNWSWIYVGCGDGLDDPNLGRLLEWSKGWGESGLPDFFLARDDKAKEIAARPGKPPNLRAIGYPSHDELPVVLRSVTPAARCWPFVRVDDEFPLFHVPGASDPFPTRQEYLDGDVPTFAADAELTTRMQTHGWACCIDVASVGKTTLALRAATTHEQRAHPVCYLDLKREIEEEADASPVAAVNRLARPGTLLILDNIHYQPELARQLWQQWNAKPSDSRGRLLLVATRIHQPVVVTPEHDLTFFERHPANPAILLQPTPEDLGRLAKHLYHRVGCGKCPPMPEPPAEALAEWHPVYRAALNAFTFAVLDSLADFQKGKWPLPPSRASAWVRKHWLGKLDAPELENAICLAVFGAQELEMLVQDDALPHPGETKKLFELGLVAQTQSGQLKQYRQFELREPGWGRLVLAALTPSVDEEQILFATASRHLQTAIVLSARLRRDGDDVRLKRLWEYLAPRADGLVNQLWDLPLPYFPNLVRLAKSGNQPELASRFWKTIEADPHSFATRAWNTALHFVASFFDVAKQHGRDTAPLWAL
ncbi:MAG TPA: SIR2 family protein, partial [Verrucomicrobiota bacterium]|nr:SIR2 family protein [Verrucomicrobiota bacterium]